MIGEQVERSNRRPATCTGTSHFLSRVTDAHLDPKHVAVIKPLHALRPGVGYEFKVDNGTVTCDDHL